MPADSNRRMVIEQSVSKGVQIMMLIKPPSYTHIFRPILMILLALHLSGCTTKHAGQALLYQQTGANYACVGSSSNPIEVPDKSTFQLTVEEVQPG